MNGAQLTVQLDTQLIANTHCTIPSWCHPVQLQRLLLWHLPIANKHVTSTKNKGFGGFCGHFQLWLKTFQDLELLTWLLSTKGPTSASSLSSVFGDPQFNKQRTFLWSNFGKTNQQKPCNKQIAHCVKPKPTLWSKHVSLLGTAGATMEEVCNKTWLPQTKNKY